jgi:hypothetical protein
MSHMSRFLHDRGLGQATKRVINGDHLRCAVAFWGNGAVRTLFAGSPSSDARLICDTTMGGTNPSELEKLGAPDNPNLRHLPGLHAKVYLSSNGLVTGSANASNNGLGFTSEAALVEAATFHAPDEDAFAAAAAWFERLWRLSNQVDSGALEVARAAWRRRPRGAMKVGEIVYDPASLLDAVLADPTRFRGVGFVFTTSTSTAEHRDETALGIIRKDDARRVPLLSRSVRKSIGSWPVHHVFSEWNPEDVSAWPERFICVHRSSRGRISYWFYRRAHSVMLSGARGMVLAELAGSLRRALRFHHGIRVMAEVDRQRLLAAFDEMGDEWHRLFESGEKLAAFLAEVDPGQ